MTFESRLQGQEFKKCSIRNATHSALHENSIYSVRRQFVSYSCKLSSIGMEWNSSDPPRRLVSACPAERPRPATEMDLSARAMMIKLHCSSHIGLGGGAFLFYLNQQCHHADHLLPLHQQVEPEIHRREQKPPSCHHTKRARFGDANREIIRHIHPVALSCKCLAASIQQPCGTLRD
jgi:hypothetical protein